VWNRELRPTSPEESDELIGLMKGLSGRGRRASITFTSGCLAGTVPALILLLTGLKDSVSPAACLSVIGLAAGIGGVVGLRLAGRPDGDTRRLCEELKGDLRQGLVEEIHATAESAAKIATAGYLLQVGEGELMFVEMRVWDAATDSPSDGFDEVFPCPEFHLVRAPRSGADLGISCRGPRFAPSWEVDPETAALADGSISDGDVFPGRLTKQTV